MTKTNVPRLRFNEFSGEWREEKAKEIFVNESIKNHEQEEVLASTQKDGIVFRKDMDIDIKFDKSTLKNYKYVTPGNVVISLRSFQGGFEISDKRGIISPAYTIMSFKDSKNNKDYWKQYLKTYKFIQSLKKVTFGIRDGRSISFTEFSTLKLKFTENKKEQQKIGSFFAKIDKLIELQTEKLEHLKKLKRAYLQKMFPQDGESVPRLRFSGFSGKWKKKNIAELTIRLDSERVPVKEQDRVSGNVPYYGANGIQGYVKGFTHTGNNILIAEDGASDVSNYPVIFTKGNIWVNNHAHVLQSKDSKSDSIFISYALKLIRYDKYLTGNGRFKLNADVLMKIGLLIPSLEEQQQIGAFLSKLDQIINSQSDKIENFKRQKKAYLQKMFI